MGDVEKVQRVGSSYSPNEVRRFQQVNPDRERKRREGHSERDEPHDEVELHLASGEDEEGPVEGGSPPTKPDSGLDIAV